MAGVPINELKKAVLAFIALIERLDLGERIALVEFGNDTKVICSFTNNYDHLKRLIRGLRANGGTPMGRGLAYCLRELAERGRAVSFGE